MRRRDRCHRPATPRCDGEQCEEQQVDAEIAKHDEEHQQDRRGGAVGDAERVRHRSADDRIEDGLDRKDDGVRVDKRSRRRQQSPRRAPAHEPIDEEEDGRCDQRVQPLLFAVVQGLPGLEGQGALCSRPQWSERRKMNHGSHGCPRISFGFWPSGGTSSGGNPGHALICATVICVVHSTLSYQLTI